MFTYPPEEYWKKARRDRLLQGDTLFATLIIE